MSGKKATAFLYLFSNDFIDGGLDKDESLKTAEITARAGIDCIEVSRGTPSESKDYITVKGIQSDALRRYLGITTE